MPEIVFILCTLTSLACSALLLRAYARSRTPLLLWSGVCFAGLTANSALVFVDLIVIPQTSILPLRTATTLASLLVLIVALVWGDRGGAR